MAQHSSEHSFVPGSGHRARQGVLSDDKRNGYNALWREAIFRGVRRFYPELLPTVRMFYLCTGWRALHTGAAAYVS
jgi:hypothetical protein